MHRSFSQRDSDDEPHAWRPTKRGRVPVAERDAPAAAAKKLEALRARAPEWSLRTGLAAASKSENGAVPTLAKLVETVAESFEIVENASAAKSSKTIRGRRRYLASKGVEREKTEGWYVGFIPRGDPEYFDASGRKHRSKLEALRARGRAANGRLVAATPSQGRGYSEGRIAAPPRGCHADIPRGGSRRRRGGATRIFRGAGLR